MCTIFSSVTRFSITVSISVLSISNFEQLMKTCCALSLAVLQKEQIVPLSWPYLKRYSLKHRGPVNFLSIQACTFPINFYVQLPFPAMSQHFCHSYILFCLSSFRSSVVRCLPMPPQQWTEPYGTPPVFPYPFGPSSVSFSSNSISPLAVFLVREPLSPSFCSFSSFLILIKMYL